MYVTPFWGRFVLRGPANNREAHHGEKKGVIFKPFFRIIDLLYFFPNNCPARKTQNPTRTIIAQDEKGQLLQSHKGNE